jgi:MFS family permease
VIVLLGLSSTYGVSLALMFVAGITGITATVTANTRLQLLTPDVFRGRVSSLFVLLIGGTTPIGAILLGGIAEVWGIRAGLSVFGTLTVLGLLAVLALERRSAGEDDVREPDALRTEITPPAGAARAYPPLPEE